MNEPKPASVAEWLARHGGGTEVNREPWPPPLVTCSETHDVDRGYGKLRCDLRHPHPGMHHHDPEHRIIWRADYVERGERP